MEILHIVGQQKLEGTVEISGAKQSALPCLVAALLTEESVTIENVPMIEDVEVMVNLLKELGVRVERDGERMTIHSNEAVAMPLLGSETRKVRAAVYLLGVFAARFGKGAVGLPGGYAIGPRPIDLHLKALERLGIHVENESGLYHVRVDELVGNRIYLDLRSFGATVSAMLAAVLATGTTVIENAACDPEVVDVATMLTSMGAHVSGAGTDEIRIKGVERLHGCTHTLIPDRLEAGTFMMFGAVSGHVTVQPVIPTHLEGVIQKLLDFGADVEVGEESITVTANQFMPTDIRVFHYSGYPSDLQPVMTAALLKANGTSVVTDKLYAQRFRHIAEMRRMNAQITLEDASAVIRGGNQLANAEMECTDARSAAALVLSALQASGESTLLHAERLNDSYVDFVGKLKQLGALVWVEEHTEV
ncbi:UDP-N-acetylglucosamine 1-carboxyvinyltransferase [Exiguobacterium sp. PFWT01]|uniref:UDP-N-acetylglucosamine 1-carboxyvinyltransferase n=1 Tax=Exiguobacterium TaxID=33986 RepID=UPI001BAA658A|nr:MULTISPECIES: UDP-N-acetylglucosamine 1-carboxyvinyltransferase [Exiguobacterium]QUP87549.1 UDP-N-acetylglucosamine 1-carboxyvinyltransferase [Exiguobacterium sp. PFWT01]